MDRLTRAWQTILAAGARLTVSQKLLIGSVAVLLAMTLFVVSLYTSQSESVALLPGKPPEDQQRAAEFLRTRSVKFTSGAAGEVMVAPAVADTLRAQMAEGNVLTGDNRVLFDNLIQKQSWTLSQQQNQQMEVIAVQNELAQIISHMSGIRSASVILNLPSRRGLGEPRTNSSASATVFPTRALSQDTVDSIAHLIASSRGIDVRHVRVIDGATNRQMSARDESGWAASSYLEYVTKVEERKQAQLHEMLAAYIPGVIVSVHAQVDVTRRNTTRNEYLPEGQGSVTPLLSETARESENRQPAPSGEPGVRSNTGQDITGLGAPAATTKETTGETRFDPRVGSESTQISDPRGHPTKINAVVNIPRGYFVEVWRSRQPAPAAGAASPPAEPAESDLNPIVEAETARIKREIEPLIDTSAADQTVRGEVQVSMIPVLTLSALPGAGGASGASALGLGVGTLAADGLVRTLMLGGLATVALGLVVVMAMRATKRESLPTAAELVGLPPALEGTTDLVGEATEADSVLQGLELSDDEMKHRKMMEQVSELVDEKPEDAARLLGRWVQGV
ncbi:MAG TPA: hypothetical protein DEB06_04540 [Phycisphaerales bacterium]|nr:hypothetical protein [Phycisphaerales bacterium]